MQAGAPAVLEEATTFGAAEAAGSSHALPGRVPVPLLLSLTRAPEKCHGQDPDQTHDESPDHPRDRTLCDIAPESAPHAPDYHRTGYGEGERGGSPDQCSASGTVTLMLIPILLASKESFSLSSQHVREGLERFRVPVERHGIGVGITQLRCCV
jgi:hypothetical protein